jgi:hypothetical protein
VVAVAALELSAGVDAPLELLDPEDRVVLPEPLSFGPDEQATNRAVQIPSAATGTASRPCFIPATVVSADNDAREVKAPGHRVVRFRPVVATG